MKSKKTTTIPAGYRLTVTSWENDADNYNTKVVTGLSASDARFYVDLCKILSRNNKKSSFGNMYEPSKDERKKFFEHIKSIVEVHNRADYQGEYWQDHIVDLLYDLGLSGGEFFTRVCDSFRVEYIDEPILIDDVTSDFI